MAEWLEAEAENSYYGNSPIESAPMDGTKFIGIGKEYVYVTEYIDGRGYVGYCHETDYKGFVWTPSYWTPFHTK